jgi:hypothetical protein
MRTTIFLLASCLCLCGTPAIFAQQPAGEAICRDPDEAAATIAKAFVAATAQKKGKVASISAKSGELYITLGANDGMIEGQTLQIIAQGDPIIVDAQTIGFEEYSIGLAEIVRVQNEKLCVAKMVKTEKDATGKEKTPARENIAYLQTIPTYIAITPFRRSDRAMSLFTQEFSDKVGQALQKAGKFQVLDRTSLDKLLREKKLSYSGLFDQTNTTDLCSFISAKALVFCNISMDDLFTMLVTVVDLATGRQITSVQVKCIKTDQLQAKFNGIFPDIAQAAASTVSDATNPPSGTKKLDFTDGSVPVVGCGENCSGYGVDFRKGPLTMTGLIADYYISHAHYGAGSTTFDIRGYDMLDCYIGVPDKERDSKGTVNIDVNGKQQVGKDYIWGKDIEHVVIDLTGKSTVRIEVRGSAVVANAKLFKKQ